jgi:hypothetical protein
MTSNVTLKLDESGCQEKNMPIIYCTDIKQRAKLALSVDRNGEHDDPGQAVSDKARGKLLRQVENGEMTARSCKDVEIMEQMYFRWRKSTAGYRWTRQSALN